MREVELKGVGVFFNEWDGCLEAVVFVEVFDFFGGKGAVVYAYVVYGSLKVAASVLSDVNGVA